ncbi:MAG TPA: AsmA-like C-terminal region-containing protein, partial [Xanthobacteraceae bacterium]
VLSARQIDLDRALADASNRRPLAVLRALAQSMGAALRPPLELGIGIGVDAVTLGGAALQSVRADFAGDGQAWTVERLEVRAPGSTQVRLSGRLDAHDFVGSLAIEAVDPATLVAWLGASQPSQRAIGPLRLRGEVTLGRERWAIERASAEYDRQAIEGRLAYVLSAGDRPARLEAALRAAEFDLDGALALAKNALVGAGLERPGEIALAVDFGRVTFAGITAKAATADIRLDAAGLSIERLAVADFGGAALTGSGRIDLAAPPHGAIALGLEARSIDGLAVLLAPFAPKAADLMRRSAAQVAPATLNASFKIDPPAQSGAAATIGRLTLDGRLGGVRVTLSAEGHGDIAALSDLRIAGRATSEDGALATLLGLGGVAGARGPVSLNIAAHGPGGELRVTAALSGEGLQADARGMLRLNDREPGGSFDLSFAASDVRMLARDGPLPVSFTSRVALAGRDLILRDLAGNVGAAAVRGELTVALDPLRVGGKIAADRIDLPAVIATAIGMPRASGALPTQTLVLPFAGIAGRIAFEADEARLAPAIVARKLRGTAGFGPTELTFDNVAGILGAGGLSADATIRSGAGGLSARARLAISNAEAAALLGSHTVRGRVSARFEVEGVGPSAAALIGSLNGTGAVTLEGAEIAGLDAKAIDVAIRAAERAAPIAPARLADLVNRALDVGSLAVPWASAPVTISAGRARLGKLVTPPQTNDFAVTGGVDLVEGAIDLRVTLFGPPSGSAQRPDVSVVLKGPIGAPRRAVDVSALAEWLTLQAVDREAKRLEAAEQAAKRLQAAEEAAKRVEAA